MKLILTNYGHKLLLINNINDNPTFITDIEKLKILKKIRNEIILDETFSKNYEYLISNGLVEVIENNDFQKIKFKYNKNPLEFVDRVVVEFTTECNFNCKHCRNGSLNKITETNIPLLINNLHSLKLLGINKFEFIGGEVTKFANGWLNVTKEINKDFDQIISVYTNGWWINKSNFDAAGKIYLSDIDYITDLKNNGVTHIVFSIDGYKEKHNISRGINGLYDNIISVLPKVKNAGLKPQISVVLKDDIETLVVALIEIATIIYDLDKNLNPESKLRILQNDKMNAFSNFIDIGNGLQNKRNLIHFSQIDEKHLICKAFYRPQTIRLQANGNISICPLLDAGEDYGNFHNNNIVELLNNFQKSFSYQLHANKQIKNYLKYYDTNIFGLYFDHICSVRSVLTIIARKMNKISIIDNSSIRKIVDEVAEYSGYNEI